MNRFICFIADRFLWIVWSFILAIFGLAIYQEVTWPAYKEEHNCKKTGQSKSEPVTICQYDAALNMTMCSTNMQTSYQWVCDNGELWRTD